MITISKYSNTIEYNLRTTLDRSGLTQLQTELNKVSVQLKEMQSQRLLDPSQVDSSISTINKFKSALNSSFNSKIGMLDMSKFVGQLQESKVSLNSLQNSFALTGNTGKAAFAGVLGQLGKIDTGIKSTSSMVDKIFNTMGNTVRWGIMSSAFNGVTDSIRQSVEYAKDLDDSLTQIMLVTDYSRDSMVQYAKQANEAAKALGSTTVAMTNASLVYSQQGFDLNKSQQLAEMSTKLANASQQDTSTTSDQITAYMNAYGLDDNIDKLNAALDSWANVANISAADVGELAEASQKAASAAATLGVSTDQLNAQIATIESVTREAPEQIGNGLKTLYARFSDLSMGKTLDDGVDLGKVTSTLDKIGVQVLDGDGKMRGVGNIMEDLMKVWDSIDSTQKAAVGQTLAGKFQLTRFEALMNRADLYKQYKAGSENANGTLDVMNEKYVDSLQGKLNKLQTTFEGIINSLGDSSDFYGFIDGLSTALDLMQKLVDSIGGGSAALTLLGATATKVFSTTMSRGIASMIQNHEVNKTRKINAQTRQQKLQEMGYNNIKENESTKPIMDFVNTGIKYQPDMNEKQAKEYNGILDSLVASVQKVTTEEDKMREAVEATNIAMRAALETSFDYLELTRNENGVLQIQPTDVYDIAIRNSQDKLGKLGTNELKQITGEQALKSSAYSANLTRSLSTIKAAKAEDATTGTKTRATAAMQTSLNRGKSLVKELMGTDNIWDDRFNEYEEKIENLRTPIQQLIVSLRELSKVINEDNYNFDAAIDTLEKVQKATNGAAEAADVATKQQNATRKEDRVPLSNVGETAQQNNKMQAAQEELKTAQGRGEGFNEGMDLQNEIQQIVQATSAIGQLGFAWQSFQNLGSIWANSDLTLGDKIEQTILNLTMMLPQLVSGFIALKEASQKLDMSRLVEAVDATRIEKLQNAFGDFATMKFGPVLSGLTATETRFKAINTGAKIASAGLKVFKGIIESLGSPLGMLSIGLIAAGSTLINFLHQKNQAAIDKQVETYTNTQQTASVDTSSFDVAYASYKKTGEVTDELKSATDNLIDSLDIAGGKALENSGDFDTLAEKIKNASTASKELAESQGKQALTALEKGASTYTPFVNNAERIAYQNDFLSNAGLTTNWIGQDTSGLSLAEKIGKVTDASAKAQKEADKQQKILDGMSKDDAMYEFRKSKVDQAKQNVSDAQDYLNDENVANAKTIIDNMVSAAEEGLNKSDFVNKSKKEIEDSLLDNEAIKAKYQSLGKEAGQEYIDGLVSAMQGGKDDVKNSVMAGLSSDISTDNLESAAKNKSSMKDVLEDYQTAYQKNGGFTEDEAANIMVEHPEYVEFLQKVGDQYQLNQRAVEQWTQKTREQTAAMKEATGEAVNMSQANTDILAAYQSLSSNNLDLQQPLQEIQQLNDLLTNGAISNSDFLDRLNSGFDTLASKIDNAVNSGQKLADVLNDDDISNFAQIMTNELYTGLQQANKQFKSGKMNVTQYSNTMKKAAQQSIKMEQATSGLTDEQVEQIKNSRDISNVTVGMTKKQKSAAKQINKLAKSMKNLDAAADFNNFVTDNFEQMNKIFEDTGKVAVDATNDMGGIKEEYSQTISGLASSMQTFYQTNTEAAVNTANAIAATGAMTQAQAYEMLTTGQGLASAMMSNSEVASAAMQGTMAEAEGAVSNMADGISGIITDIMAMFGGIDGDVTSSTEKTDSSEYDITSTEKGKGSESVGTVSVPNFKMHIKGSNNSSSKGSAASRNKNLTSTGKTRTTSDGRIQEQYVNKFTGKSTWSDVNAGSQASVKEHSKQLAKGLSSLFGSSTPSLKNWAPSGVGGAASPSNFGLPSSGSGGGGGGGGGGSSFTPDTKEALDDEIDRYERVNTLLDAIANDYERINKEQERLTGDKLVENLSKQTSLLKRQIDLQKEKLSIQNDEMNELQSKLSGYGIQFDAEGYISNYAKIHQGLIDNVNNLIGQYNAAGTEEAQDAINDQIDAANDNLDKFKTLYQRYDTLISSDLRDTIQQIEDLNDEIEDLRINIFKTQVEALDNLKDIQESLVDFDRAFNRGIKLTPYQEAADNVAKLGKYFDVATMSVDEYYDNLIKKQEDAANAAGTSDAYKKWSAGRVDELKAAKQRALNGDKSVDYYGTGYFDMSMKNLTDINAQMKQFEETGKSDIFGENSADLYDVAKTVYEQAAGLAQDYWSLIENLHDNVMDMIDDISDKMDRRKDQYEAITDELEHWLDITELLHGEESYDDLNTILGAQQNNYKAQLNELMQQRDIWKDMLGSMKEGSEEWNEVSDKIKDATSDINDLIQNSLENLQKQYSNTVSKITKAWGTKAVGTDLDWMNTQWELINRNADYYLDDVNKSYNIQKLQSKYLDLLDGSNDLAIQQKISAQMKEQLEYLRDKTKLSEYDVNYANAQLEILQKQIALEEAQRNKSQMKLRRDTQGNYSYVYTANDDNVRSAQSDLLDAQNNAYNMSKDQMKQTQADSLSALQDAQSTVNDIWNNANLSLEEKTKRTQAIIDSLKEYLAGTSEQLSTSQKNIINDFIGMCDMLTGENKDNLQDVYDQIVNGSTDAFDQIDTRWSTSLTSWLQNMDQFKADTDKMLGDLTQAGKDYADGTKTIADLAKTNFDDISNSISGTTDKTKELADSTKEFVNILKDVSGEVKKTESTMTDYANRITDANNNMQAFKQLADETANKLSKKEQENANLSEALKQAEQKNYNYEHYGNANGPSSGGGGGGAGANEDTAWGIAKAIWTYGWASGWGNDPVRSSKLTGAYGTAFARHVQDIINQYSRSGKLVDYGSMKYSSKNLIGYDTGGYTGSWSDKTADAKNGKLAVLHQKELVLNATDTQNILAAVESVRSFADGLKSTSLAQSLSTALGAVSGAKANNASETIDQNVHITAEFPAANSAAEIESALMSLNDRAVQYAYKFR